MSCQSAPSNQVSPPPASTQPPAIAKSPNVPVISSKPQPITFNINVDNPITDLIIKQGDFVRKGQAIADLGQQRLELKTQQQTLQAELDALSSRGAVSFSTQIEATNIASAQAQFNASQSALRNYEETSPWTDFARDTLPLAEEEVELTRLKNTLKQAQKNLDTAKAKLAKKQAAIEDFQNEQVAAKTQVQQQLLNVEQQIAAIKPIQSSYTGTIAKIDFSDSSSAKQPVKVSIILIPGNAPPSLKSPDGLPPETTDGTLPRNDNQSPAGSARDLQLPPIGDRTPETPSPSPELNPTTE